MTVDNDRRNVLRALLAAPVVPGAVSALLAACSGKKGAAAGGEAAAGASEAKPFGDIAVAELPWKGKFRHVDLVENLGFASLRNEGLLVDLGSTDYFKYALGRWRTGWGRDLVRDGVAYTHVAGVTTRLYFHWERKEDLVVRFRAKRYGGTYFSLYFNNKPVQRVDLTSTDWATYSVNVPASSVSAGENYLLMRWDKTIPEAGEDLAAAMDWVHIVPSAAAEAGGILPTHTAVAGSAKSGKDEAPALLLAAGMRLTYWLQIPEAEPMLGFNAGIVAPQAGAKAPDMFLKVSATADGAEPVELVSRTLEGAKAGTFQPGFADLAALRGKVVKLDIEASSATSGDARLAIVDPGLYAKPFDEAPVKPAKAARNTIVVMIDTLRADHTAAYAKTRVQSPVFNRVAREGALFERFSAVEDWTKPSCATMLTGLYPSTHKTQTENAKVPAKVRMISEEMKSQGITTAAFIANGYVSEKFGFQRGWDQYRNYIRESKPSSAEHVFGDALSWIETNKDKRFFAYVHTIDPHVPYAPPNEFVEMYDKEPYSGQVEPRQTHLLLEDIKSGKFVPTDRDKQRMLALYDGEISYHDKWFGVFLQKLADLKLLADTLIVIVSDHGEEFWDHGGVGHGHQIHQELIHVPYILMWQGTIPSQVRVPENHDHSCLVPTVLDAMQLTLPKYLEGESVLPRALQNQQPGPNAGLSNHQGDRMGVWSGSWKLIMLGPVKTFLYDLEKDANCQTDVQESHPITTTWMRTLLGNLEGHPDRTRWRSYKIEQKAGIDIQQENVEMDPETLQQLEAIGYVVKPK